MDAPTVGVHGHTLHGITRLDDLNRGTVLRQDQPAPAPQ